MRIACTNCDALYDLPPERVRPGQGVRCARCKTVWVPVEQEDAAPEIRPSEVPRPRPPGDAAHLADALKPADDEVPLPVQGPQPSEPEPEPVTVPMPGPMASLVKANDDGTVTTPLRRGRAVGPGVAWAASVILIGAFCAAVIAFRGPIAQFWPPSQRLYAWLGLG